ncbi:hypothetical protein [Novipirellula artificiosorum]|nr:hypothetical protein [Novipirellula artificiosorum]
MKTTANREAAMRRVAIVLSSLPAAVAANLISSIDPESKKVLRRTMASLSDVDPLERRRALSAFKGLVQQSPTELAAAPIDEISFPHDPAPGDASFQSHVLKQLRSESQTQSGEAAANLPTPLSFLADVEDDVLVRLLSDEHPQAVALVLASISPAQAARVLPRLESSIQNDALRRIGRLGDVPTEAIEELAGHLRQRVERQNEQQENSTGQRALSAILAAMPKQTQPSEPDSAKQAFEKSPPNITPRPAAAETPIEVHSLRVAPGTHVTADDVQVEQHAPRIKPESERNTATGSDEPILQSTDATHNYLVKLSAKELCQALAQVEMRIALLTLCGLPNPVCDAAMRCLPRAHAKQVRTQMNSLASIQLHDIDQAKATVAAASLKQRRTASDATKRARKTAIAA